MNYSFKSIACGLCAIMLAACGGGQDAPQESRLATGSSASVRAAQLSPSDYHNMVQRLYVAYFGRPADVGGLAFFAEQYLNAGAPTNVLDLSKSYGINPTVTALIDSFGNSQESRDLYPGDNTTFVTAIYRNLYNREPDAAGLAFWVATIESGAMTRGQAAVSIMAGSLGSDTDLITSKIDVASDFTSSLDSSVRAAAYSGLDANVVVRAMLGNVALGADPASTAAAIAATVDALVSVSATAQLIAQVDSIIENRCVGCHSASPTIAGFSSAPRGIAFDTSDQIRASASAIQSTVVQTRFMPFGNITGMTEEERAIIADWFTKGAP